MFIAQMDVANAEIRRLHGRLLKRVNKDGEPANTTPATAATPMSVDGQPELAGAAVQDLDRVTQEYMLTKAALQLAHQKIAELEDELKKTHAQREKVPPRLKQSHDFL
jgi:hypothetical protein